VEKVEIPLPLWDFQAQWKSPAFGLFHEAAFSTAPLPPNCAVDPNLSAQRSGELIGNRNKLAIGVRSRGQNGDAAVILMKSGVAKLQIDMLTKLLL